MLLLRSKKQLTAFYMLGFLVGIIAFALLNTDGFQDFLYLEKEFCKDYKIQTYHTGSYLWYLIKIRMLPCVILAILGKRKILSIAFPAVVAGTGFVTGSYLVIAVRCLGIGGVLFFFCSTFPFYLFYLFAYAIIYVYDSSASAQWNGKKIMFLAVSMTVGLSFEFYVTPYLLNGICRFII